ncbi:uncharacterized protein LACBIDRAFT_328195 [Laccaria bicolor S238N-H82]|uniref:Predicted protein n=1 Tax=Laccaria bicolor (strain S238N-H82 / ATCC MYA-4686) TaxID=486041 RepID=B0DE16_LACBS|nr:uncharacterized protein LACBIDRAFT_328195 [Laccaria bicolor S238N-H82]EDR07312.1 predicted protein [Laccaria bicolor S238N-H82]|eukprot:XP_001882243.1 predicted protein [Laccaria bicolor S238N-H82]
MDLSQLTLDEVAQLRALLFRTPASSAPAPSSVPSAPAPSAPASHALVTNTSVQPFLPSQLPHPLDVPSQQEFATSVSQTQVGPMAVPSLPITQPYQSMVHIQYVIKQGRGGTLLNTQFASAQHGILVGSKTHPDPHVDRSAQSLREPWEPGFQQVTAHSVPGLRSCMELGFYRLRLFGNWTTSSEGDDDDGYDDHDYVDDVKVRYIASSNGASHDLRKPRVGPLSLRICIAIGKDHLTSKCGFGSAMAAARQVVPGVRSKRGIRTVTCQSISSNVPSIIHSIQPQSENVDCNDSQVETRAWPWGWQPWLALSEVGTTYGVSVCLYCVTFPSTWVRRSFLRILGPHLLSQAWAFHSLELQLDTAMRLYVVFPPKRIYRFCDPIPIPQGVGGPSQQHACPLPLPPHDGQYLLLAPPPLSVGHGLVLELRRWLKINMMSRGSVRTGTKKRGSIITRLRHITRTRNRNGKKVRSSEGGDEEPSMADPLLLLSHHSPAVHRIPTMGADALELGSGDASALDLGPHTTEHALLATLTTRQEALDQRVEERVGEVQRAVGYPEDAVGRREEAVERREKAVWRREEAFVLREREVKEREDKVVELEQAIDERGRAFDQRGSELEERSRQVEKEIARLGGVNASTSAVGSSSWPTTLLRSVVFRVLGDKTSSCLFSSSNPSSFSSIPTIPQKDPDATGKRDAICTSRQVDRGVSSCPWALLCL